MSNDALLRAQLGALHQDILLQSHRRALLLIQVGLLLGSAVTTAAASLTIGLAALLPAACFAVVAFAAGRRLGAVCAARSLDVARWQRRIVALETAMSPEQRLFTAFKLDQAHVALDDPARTAASEDAGQAGPELIEVGGLTNWSYSRYLPVLVVAAHAIVISSAVLIRVAA